ncbi:hypothetical protein HPB49_026231 [Dermacentor silvarum]|uniref:Uncharacterized protein n=2 Tax=Dermacentor silvarum TaxID=543639 RepID=A0ACB8E0Y9_DERSI|nr:hypothetical protein HPB49_003569 [Dermacentor silvarum]KAH7980268.1 hypothetical protein HPB49_014350 [Dermacentor silvarum]KAH7985897.1 hypothetical protein HPB49_026231 [Dermacentor silvarum]
MMVLGMFCHGRTGEARERARLSSPAVVLPSLDSEEKTAGVEKTVLMNYGESPSAVICRTYIPKTLVCESVSRTMGKAKQVLEVAHNSLQVCKGAGSTDSVEHVFGIIRQSSGCNAHPSPDQFLITVNCLSFYNMERSVDGVTPEIINALLSVDDKTPYISPNSVDELLA